MKNTGTENYGGPVVTAGGLLFIGATNFDKKFRAFDKATGKLLWETTLPFAGNATPITYEIEWPPVRGHCRRRRQRPAVKVGRSVRGVRAAEIERDHPMKSSTRIERSSLLVFK